MYLINYNTSSKLCRFLKTWNDLGPVWYMCLKTENCCLKTFVEIRVGGKVR